VPRSSGCISSSQRSKTDRRQRTTPLPKMNGCGITPRSRSRQTVLGLQLNSLATDLTSSSSASSDMATPHQCWAATTAALHKFREVASDKSFVTCGKPGLDRVFVGSDKWDLSPAVEVAGLRCATRLSGQGLGELFAAAEKRPLERFKIAAVVAVTAVAD